MLCYSLKNIANRGSTKRIYCPIERKQNIHFHYFFLVLDMGFSVVCHGCGKLMNEGRDLISLYRLRRRTDEKCPGCEIKLAVRPLSINLQETERETKVGKLRKWLNMRAG